MNTIRGLVSVIVTTYNNERILHTCLQSVKKQTYNKIEIILVDNNSTDETKKVASLFTENILNKGPERSEQRNFGLKKSRGEYCIFLDSDMQLSKNVIQEGVRILQTKTDVVGLYIPERVAGKSNWAKIRNFERQFYNGTVIDCVRMVRKNAAIRAGGFDKDMFAAEDWDFQKKIQRLGKTSTIKYSLYHRPGDKSFFSYIQKKIYYSKNLSIYIGKWGKDDPQIRKQFGFWYRYFLVFTENGKWKKCVRSLDLFICMLFSKIIVGFLYVLYGKKN